VKLSQCRHESSKGQNLAQRDAGRVKDHVFHFGERRRPAQQLFLMHKAEKKKAKFSYKICLNAFTANDF
jgi:hypothetical protein